MQPNNQLNLNETKDRNWHMQSILLLNPIDAKEKLLKENVVEEVVAAIVALGTKQPALMSALVQCACSSHTARAIAQSYSIHPSTLTYYSRVVGLPKRRRGRHPRLQPTSKHQQILDSVKTYGITATARQIGVSKQWVFYVVKKWLPGLKGPQKPSKVVSKSARKRGPRRTVIVSFRLSIGEWNQLLTSKVIGEQNNLSGRQKARAILLHQIGQASTLDKVSKQGFEDTISNASF